MKNNIKSSECLILHETKDYFLCWWIKATIGETCYLYQVQERVHKNHKYFFHTMCLKNECHLFKVKLLLNV